MFGFELRPDRIERLQPLAEPEIQRGRVAAVERLDKVVVCVHQPGKDDAVPRVDHPVKSLLGGRALLYALDQAVLDEQITAREPASLPVEVDEREPCWNLCGKNSKRAR